MLISGTGSTLTYCRCGFHFRKMAYKSAGCFTSILVYSRLRDRYHHVPHVFVEHAVLMYSSASRHPHFLVSIQLHFLGGCPVILRSF